MLAGIVIVCAASAWGAWGSLALEVDIYRFIHTEKAEFSVQTVCRALGVSTSSFYDWEHQPQSGRARRDVELSQAIGESFTDKRLVICGYGD